jgi:hypothetical protein
LAQIKNIFRALLGFSLLSGPASSQSLLITDPSYLNSKSEGDNVSNRFLPAYPDTSVYEVHNFIPRNFLGNIGLPSPEYRLAMRSVQTGFRLAESPYRYGTFESGSVNYYQSKGPYADLTGMAGSRELQMFRMLFMVTVKKTNLTVRFNRYSSLGFYYKQQATLSNFYLSSNSALKSKRAGYYFYLYTNAHKHDENGGVRHALNDSSLSVHKELLPVKLGSARRENEESCLMFNPWLRLNKPNDTLENTGHFLQIKSRLNLASWRYTDNTNPGDGYYFLFYNDSTATKDSTHLTQWSNEAAYTMLDNKGNGFTAGYRHEINRVWQQNDSVFQNHHFFVSSAWSRNINTKDTSAKSKKRVENNASFQYVLFGANQGDYKAEDKLSYLYNPVKRRSAYLHLILDRRHPDYIYNTWSSNHFSWRNNYRPFEQIQAESGLQLGSRFGISAYYKNVFRYLYYDDLAMPQQYNGTIQALGIQADLRLVLLKHLGLHLNYARQFTTHQTYLRIPPAILRANLYYTGIHFHGNLQISFGGQLEIYDSFTPYGYMPATQAFYLQNDFRTASYPFLDLYVNARIRPVKIFLKVENALFGYVGSEYSFTPGYYQPDFAIRFGINWVFFD